MAGKIHHFKNYSIIDGDIRIELDMSRLEGRFNKAQYALDSAIMNSMEPFMPKRDGTFIDETREESTALAGTGRVCAAAGPFGRFLYMGKTMVDEKTGSPWAREGAKKVLVSQYREKTMTKGLSSQYREKTKAKENLEFSRAENTEAQPEWFEAAKKADGDAWNRTVKKIAGGGANG